LVGIGAVLVFGTLTLLVIAAVGAYFAEQQLTAWWSTPSTPSTLPVSAPTPPAPVMTSVPFPIPSLPSAPPPTSIAPPPVTRAMEAPSSSHLAGVHVVVSTLGALDTSVAEDIAARARSGLAACRDRAAHHENVEFVVTILGALQSSGLPSESPAHHCIVSAFRATGPVHGVSSGIARFDVTLDPL
jgi:hypothetical protein